ncbi:hypothetical protein K7X08_025716 [Anisodus acutangulus]|uniref:Uncharacterized protein n=1 Tax=Anisodus acutangulus TaxID=402998 RepID=A0A9Q1LAR1_9SOLA|nr:hypothetical protein K7X08_025716 [Anisodus acutangulus]
MRDINKDITNSNKETIDVDSDVAKDENDIVNKDAEINVANESMNNKVSVKVEGDNNKIVENEDHSQDELLPSSPIESEIQSYGQLMVSVDGKVVGSYPPSREDLIQVVDVSREEREEIQVADKAMEHVNVEKQLTS